MQRSFVQNGKKKLPAPISAFFDKHVEKKCAKMPSSRLTRLSPTDFGCQRGWRRHEKSMRKEGHSSRGKPL
jgi:hypothetical protein